MRKISNMGGGEFELIPSLLENKIEKRNLFIDNKFKYINNELNRFASDYVESGLGTSESFKEEIIKKLIKQFREIE